MPGLHIINYEKEKVGEGGEGGPVGGRLGHHACSWVRGLSACSHTQPDSVSTRRQACKPPQWGTLSQLRSRPPAMVDPLPPPPPPPFALPSFTFLIIPAPLPPPPGQVKPALEKLFPGGPDVCIEVRVVLRCALVAGGARPCQPLHMRPHASALAPN